MLADANVLYSRVLRDYLLYAADQEIIAITWSSQILAEVTEPLEENVAGARGRRDEEQRRLTSRIAAHRPASSLPTAIASDGIANSSGTTTVGAPAARESSGRSPAARPIAAPPGGNPG